MESKVYDFEPYQRQLSADDIKAYNLKIAELMGWVLQENYSRPTYKNSLGHFTEKFIYHESWDELVPAFKMLTFVHMHMWPEEIIQMRNLFAEGVLNDNIYKCYDVLTLVVQLLGDKAIKVYPVNGYAPGNYTIMCGGCGVQDMADKRAVRCKKCATGINRPNGK